MDSAQEESESADSLLRAVASTSIVLPAPREGDVIGGNFRVESKLGAGASGVVYLAHDLRLHRRIALKLHIGGEGAHRIDREARVIAQLAHPNVVTVHDVGEWRGRTYIAMEFLDGGTLRAWLGARARGWREIVSVFIAAGRGLEAAHRAGLVHRDFKPDNVLLGSNGRVCVADFGLARPVRTVPPARGGEPGAPASWLGPSSTASEVCAGTPGYMAPEVERGDEIDARADQYSFCVALRAALVRRRIGPVIERGLRADPARRHASMGALLDALESQQRRRVYAKSAAIISLALSLGLFWVPDRSASTAAGCPAPAPSVLYVDAAAAPRGNGSSACPYRTITDALAVPGHERVVHIAAGRYDAAHGERLPLLVRGTTTLRGAGANATVIAGTGYFDPRPSGLAIGQFPLRATLVVGDEYGTVVVSGLRIDSGQHATVSGTSGILCTHGNLHAFEGLVPPPNTRLEHVSVGPGYETALVVTGGTVPRLTGCNLSLSSGIVHDSHIGIWQVGCGGDDAPAPTALAVANSTFRGSRNGGEGVAIKIWDCARAVRVTDSLFTDSDFGILLIRHEVLQPGASHDPDDPPAVLERNQFGRLGRYGVFLERAVIAELRNNAFYDSPTAIAIYSTPNQPPRVLGRKNRLWQNGVGIDVHGIGELAPDTAIDFGRTNAPGGNVFSCNAIGDDPEAATIAVRVPAAPGASLDFAGNQWDHAPPRVHRGRRTWTSPRVEVALAAAPVAIETRDSTWTGDRCSKP